MSYEEKRDVYRALCATADAAERNYLEAKDAARRLLLAVANETVGVGDVVKDVKGELKVTRVQADYAFPDDKAWEFKRPYLYGVRRKSDGTWGKREVHAWNGYWSVVSRVEQEQAHG